MTMVEANDAVGSVTSTTVSSTPRISARSTSIAITIGGTTVAVIGTVTASYIITTPIRITITHVATAIRVTDRPMTLAIANSITSVASHAVRTCPRTVTFTVLAIAIGSSVSYILTTIEIIFCTGGTSVTTPVIRTGTCGAVARSRSSRVLTIPGTAACTTSSTIV